LVRRLLVVGLALCGAGLALFYGTLPDVAPLAKGFPRTTAFMETRRQELARAGQNPGLEWTPVPLARISPTLRRAVVIAEDERFYEHAGVDWDAVRQAARKDWERGTLRVGASTITQQLAKNLYLSPARTPWRKLRELAIARRLEATLSKQRILELYLNVVEFGARTYGAEAAARRYFGKSAASLSAREAATLAAVIASPRIYDPVRHPERVARRAAQILKRMRLSPDSIDEPAPERPASLGPPVTPRESSFSRPYLPSRSGGASLLSCLPVFSERR
jgi:monofunctional biosynthetic peptidoglycan transglycosylase